TLLRADVFGAAQASIVARLRKRVPAADAIAQATEAIGEDAYAAGAIAYAQVRAQLHLECLATLAALMEAGAADGAILLDQLGGRSAVAAVLGALAARTGADSDGAVGDAERAWIGGALRSAIAEPGNMPGEVETLLRAAVAATRKVSRAGFRREDRGE